MIELNCNYEESKKIKELGYDFSFICRDYELHEEGKIIKFILLEHDDEMVNLWDSSLNKAYAYSSPKSWWIIPLIPKAALEKCLPLIDGVIWKRFPAAGDGLLRCTGLNHRTVETCTGFHEFLWCHENYPKELKAKFDEVMA
jgi:hypothetical protein